MHRLFFAGLKPVFEHANLTIFQQHLVILRYCGEFFTGSWASAGTARNKSSDNSRIVFIQWLINT
jgi:hypothetical protein